MKKPNDIKRKRTDSGAETRERKRNQKYVWVSKRILEVPVFAADGSLTNIKQMVAEKHGRTFVSAGGRPSKKAFRKQNKGLLTAAESDSMRRVLGR
jgi:hypothetical protein